jgi:dipeptidyl aminopeptidase/acylaminoacyl peptidase
MICRLVLLSFALGQPTFATESSINVLLPSADSVQQKPTYHSEDVSYRNGAITLGALLMIPESRKRLPAAVIIQGSGSSDRTNQWARAIAEVLVNKGTVVLLTDKRGSGKSEGNWQTADFNDLAADAIAGVQYLRARNEIDSE